MTFEQCHQTLVDIRRQQGTRFPLLRVDYWAILFSLLGLFIFLTFPRVWFVAVILFALAVLTKITAIASHVWDMHVATESNDIDVYVGLLRRKVDRGADRKLIHTVVGMGYMLSAEDPNA